MYSITLANGTTLSNLNRANNGAFWFEGMTFPTGILTSENLAFATIEKDGELDEVLMDYTLQDLCVQGGYVQFRVAPMKKYEDEDKHRKEKEQKKKRERMERIRMEKEMEKKGW